MAKPHKKPRVQPTSANGKPRVLVCQNRRTKHVLTLESRYEAGLMLSGTEVKALRAGRAHLNEAYVQIVRGQPVLVGGHIGEYSHGNRFNHAPTRSRRLLLHRKEIDVLSDKLGKEGYTALPLSLYFGERGLAKLEFAVGRGKTTVDKRQDIKAREADRDVARVLRRGNRGSPTD